MKLLSLIGALLLSAAPVQSQPNFLYSDICKKSEENLKGCKVMFIQGGIASLCEVVKNGELQKGDVSEFVEGMLKVGKGEVIFMVEEAIALSKLMNPDCGL